MKTTANYSQWFVEATAAAARDAFKKFAETNCAWHHLYYKPQGLAFAIVQDETPAPEGFELATPERIPSDRTIEGLTGWIRDRTRSVPVLPGD